MEEFDFSTIMESGRYSHICIDLGGLLTVTSEIRRLKRCLAHKQYPSESA